MKVLALVNVSNLDDLTCDSGVIFQRILSQELRKYDVDYVLLGPDVEVFKNLQIEGVRIRVAGLGTTRYCSRFSFDWKGIKEVIEEENPDVIFNNQVELTAALRSVLLTEGRSKTALVSYCHYPSIWGIHAGVPEIDGSLDHHHLGMPIVFDILSALVTADAFLIQSEFAKSLITSAAAYYNVSRAPEIHVISPPADPLVMGELLKAAPKNRCLLYNHRLYQSYGTEEFLLLARSLASKGIDVVVSDPMPARSKKRNSLSPTPALFRDKISQMPRAHLVDGNVSREHYRDVIQSCRIACGAFRKACVWSMAAMDCMSLGIPVVAPNYASYPEFIPEELLFNNLEQAERIASRLMDDDAFWLRSSARCYESSMAFLPSKIARKLFLIFSSLVESKTERVCVSSR
jgi:hypothetical protein